MLIDWFTVVAQAINFLLLVYLLKRFLYGPIIRAMEERERKIAERLEMAEQQSIRAEAEAATYREKTLSLEERRESLLTQAKNEAEEQRKALLHQARLEVDEAEQRWRKALAQAQAGFRRALREQLAVETCALARQTLATLANAKLDHQTVQLFLRKLANLDQPNRQALQTALEHLQGSVLIRSGFPLPEPEQRELRRALIQITRQDLSLSYETLPELLCGMEVVVGGWKLGWSFKEYLDAFERRLMKEIEAEANRERLHPKALNLSPAIESTSVQPVTSQ